VACDETGEEVALIDRPGFEQLDRHAVAVARAEPYLHRTESDALAAEQDRPAELSGQEAQRVGGVGGRERDVVEVVAIGHERARLGRGDVGRS